MKLKKWMLATILSCCSVTICSKELDTDAAKKILGGATVQITNIPPNSNVVKDQLFLRGEITHKLQPGYVKVVQDTGNGKNWTTAVTTYPSGAPDEQRGSWTSNISYPLTNSRSSIKIRVCNRTQGEGENGNTNCTIIPQGISEISNIGRSPDVRVVKVWFHMLADLNSIASVDKGRVEKVVDWIANGNSTSILPGGKLPLDYYNADYILGECQTSQRIQMRFHALDVVNTTNWEPKGYSYLIFMPLFYNNLDNKRTSYLPFAFGDYVASIDPNSDYFHVFFTGVMRKKNGDSIIGRSNMGSPEPKVSLIVIEASTFNTMDFRDAARLLVHEFGHEAGGLVHAEGPCQGNPGSNIMCPLIAGPTGAGDYWGMQGTRSQCGFLYDTHRLRNGTHQYR